MRSIFCLNKEENVVIENGHGGNTNDQIRNCENVMDNGDDERVDNDQFDSGNGDLSNGQNDHVIGANDQLGHVKSFQDENNIVGSDDDEEKRKKRYRRNFNRSPS
jgi:hypothetical protein